MKSVKPKKSYVVYMAVNQITGRRYIGATSVGFLKRQHQHTHAALSGGTTCTKFHRALRKYGPGSFKWLIIGKALSQKELYAKEIELIAQLKPELNITRGGQGIVGLRRTKSWYKKVSKALKGRKPHPSCLEALRKKGWGHQFKSVVCLNDGKFFESVKAAAAAYGIGGKGIGEVLHGRQYFCGRYSFVYANAPLPEDHRASLLAEMRAKSAAAPYKRNASKRKPVVCLDDGKEYPSCTAASAAYGLKSGEVSWICRVGKSAQTSLRFCFKELAKI